MKNASRYPVRYNSDKQILRGHDFRDFLVILKVTETNIVGNNLILQKFDITTIKTDFKIQDT
jgi:hypothetical protein